jgi:hypothetical protein
LRTLPIKAPAESNADRYLRALSACATYLIIVHQQVLVGAKERRAVRVLNRRTKADVLM